MTEKQLNRANSIKSFIKEKREIIRSLEMHRKSRYSDRAVIIRVPVAMAGVDCGCFSKLLYHDMDISGELKDKILELIKEDAEQSIKDMEQEFSTL